MYKRKRKNFEDYEKECMVVISGDYGENVMLIIGDYLHKAHVSTRHEEQIQLCGDNPAILIADSSATSPLAFAFFQAYFPCDQNL